MVAHKKVAAKVKKRPAESITLVAGVVTKMLVSLFNVHSAEMVANIGVLVAAAPSMVTWLVTKFGIGAGA